MLEDILNEYKLNSDQAISVLFASPQEKLLYNETELFYPASLIKLFAASLAQASSNEAQIQTAIKASLKDSDNDALSLLYDFLTDTRSGPVKSDTETKEFIEKRLAFSKHFHDLGFSDDLKLHNKCFSFAPYGLDNELFQEHGSNQVSISDIESIMNLIIERQEILLEYMKRDGSDYQSEFIYKGIDKIDFCYSKAAWTSTVRHDVAYFSCEDEEYLLIIMTKGLSDQEDLITEIAQKITKSVITTV